MTNPPIDIWPILERLGITISQNADKWGYRVALKSGAILSGSGHESAELALEEVLHLIIGYAGR